MRLLQDYITMLFGDSDIPEEYPGELDTPEYYIVGVLLETKQGQLPYFFKFKQTHELPKEGFKDKIGNMIATVLRNSAKSGKIPPRITKLIQASTLAPRIHKRFESAEEMNLYMVEFADSTINRIEMQDTRAATASIHPIPVINGMYVLPNVVAWSKYHKYNKTVVTKVINGAEYPDLKLNGFRVYKDGQWVHSDTK